MHFFFSQYKGDDHNPYLPGWVLRCHKVVYMKHLVACLGEREHTAPSVSYVHPIGFWPQSNWGRHDAVPLGTEIAKRGAFACRGWSSGISLRFPKHASSSAMMSFPVCSVSLVQPYTLPGQHQTSYSSIVFGPNTVLYNTCSVNGFWMNIYLSLIPFLSQHL